ncbi:MAG: rod shape-determining protein MreC [Clostridia bacterium]|nr:rod shape-determining protein MreC [Clostridia bacterium]
MKRKRGLQNTIIILTVVALLFMAVSFVAPKNSVVGNIVGIVVTPVQKVFTGIGNGIVGFFNYFGSVKELREENAVLTAQVERLENSTRELQSLQAENARLTTLLAMKESLEQKGYDTVGARIVSSDSQFWFTSFTVDRGSKDGIDLLDVCVTEAGVVGYVSEVGLTWARVTAIVDNESSVGASVARTTDKGLVEGNQDLTQSGLVQMNYLSSESSVVPGDFVETSGFGEIYPPGLMIGRIREITTDETALTKTALVETAVDFANLNEVLIIKNAKQEE